MAIVFGTVDAWGSDASRIGSPAVTCSRAFGFCECALVDDGAPFGRAKVLGCWHLISDKHNGVEIQASSGMIVCRPSRTGARTAGIHGRRRSA